MANASRRSLPPCIHRITLGDKLGASVVWERRYPLRMKSFDPFEPRMSEEAFHEYLRVCQELYLEMLQAGTWLWPEDSSNPDDLLESEDS